MWDRIKRLFPNKLRPPLSYGILRPCYRCVYCKSKEPALIISMMRGPRVIVNYNGKTYTRMGKCLGYSNCGKCFKAIDNNLNLPCKWKHI